MKKQTIQKIAATLLPAAFLFAIASPAFAQVNVDAGASVTTNVGTTSTSAGVSASGTTNTGSTTATTKAAAKAASHQASVVVRANTEIQTRISTLNALLTRLNSMKHVSASEKTSLSASIQTTISSLTTLDTKIAADTTAADLKTDAASITAGTRVYALVEPQLRIVAAADSAQTVSDTIAAVGAKTQTRITTAQSAGKDVASLITLQADMTAQLSDANTQSAAAITLVATLTPDNGDKTIAASNDTALKNARADVATATKDLKTAQSDVMKIIAGLKGMPTVAPTASASASATTTTQ